MLDALAAIRRFESGDDYYIGYSGVDLRGYPLNQYGFPLWNGVVTKWGMTHAAGAYQFEPGTWMEFAILVGAWNFSRATQDAIAAACYRKRGFQDWAPYDTKLAAFIMANGGPSAFGLVTS